MNFSNANAIVFKALQCGVTSIFAQDQLGEEIISRYEADDWPRDHVVVTDLVTSKSATVLISSGRGGQIEFAANAAVNPAQLNIANAEANFQVAYSSNVGTKIVAAKHLTPLFKVSGIKRRLLRRSTFVRRGEPHVTNEVNDQPAVRFTELNYDDFR